MKSTRIRLVVALVVLQFIALASAFAGGEGNVGGGTDQLPYDYGSAWFTGRQNHVRYCIVADSGFGVSAAFAENQLSAAYGQWDSYLFRILSTFHNLTTSLRRMGTCDGTEDLRIYLGSTSDEVAREKAKYVNPMAFSFRTQFNDRTGWGKGFVWVASANELGVDWSLGNNLLGILLHEVGHILGCSHVDGTIMRPDNDSYVRGNYPDSQRLLGQIDGQRQLFLQTGRDFDYSGTLAYGYGKGYNRPDTTASELDQIARVFLKRQFKGKVEARVTSPSYSHNGKNTYTYVLHIADESGTTDTPITFTENPDWAERPFETRFNRQGKIFYTVGPGIESEFSSMGLWAYGTADLGGGKSISVILEQNMNSLLSLKYIGSDGIHNLFRAKY